MLTLLMEFCQILLERIDNSPIDKMIITDSILARNDVKESTK